MLYDIILYCILFVILCNTEARRTSAGRVRQIIARAAAVSVLRVPGRGRALHALPAVRDVSICGDR